jgi:hypothetical protein
MAKKKNSYKPPLQAYLIEVSVDIDGNFTYLSNGQDALTLRPRVGDTISWSVKVLGVPVPFQVTFPDYGPFGIVQRVVRSMHGHSLPATVTVSPLYHGNLVFKYTVSVPNGWSDDPDVEPVISDGMDPNAQDQNVILLSIVDGNLLLNSDNASFPFGQITWKWDGTAQDDFTLTFHDAVPPNWPTVATSQLQRIALYLDKPAAHDGYTIELVNFDLSADGNLTIG